MPSDQTLVLFSIGPVQSFIASARKTEDLWAGSYVLSYLVEQSIEELHLIVRKYDGAVEMIFPSDNENTASAHVAAFPNRFLAQVTMNSQNILAVCQELTKYIYTEFEEICLFGLEDAFAGSDLDDTIMRQQTVEQANGLLEVNWATEPLAHKSYGQARKNVESRLGAVKNNRQFPLQAQDGVVCTVCGEHQALHEFPHGENDSIGQLRYQLRQTWDKLSSKYSNKEEQEELADGRKVSAGRIRNNESLCGVCLGKRTAREYFLSYTNRRIPRFRSTIEIADPLQYYAVLRMDGDDMGRWLAGEKAKLSEPAGTIAYNRLVSERLARFSGKAVPQLIAKSGGELVYSGGDDVLAFVPVSVLLGVMNRLRADFQSMEYGLHSEATASFGVVIVHKAYPLSLALQHAHNLENRAKNFKHPFLDREKDAIGMAVYTRSGEVSDFVVPWMLRGSYAHDSSDNMCIIMTLLIKSLQGELSTTFAQNFTEALLPLLGTDSNGTMKISICTDPVLNKEALTTEMNRLLERSLISSNSQLRSQLPELAADLVEVHELMKSSRDFFNWLKAMQFFARMQKQEVNS